MGVKVRQWKGAWWLFINHQGSASRNGLGPEKPGAGGP
jgi:hypothetical protein